MAMLKLSKNRAVLLRLFFTNPDQTFYIQEIGRILDKKPGVFQRNLYDMEREGILISEYKANARYFRANKDYPLYKEYKSIVFRTIGAVGSIKEVLEKAGGVDFSFLYGSFVKNKENYLSDIDVIIIGSPDENKIVRDLDNLEKILRREINYKLYRLAEFQENVQHHNPFVRGILEDRIIMLTGDENGLRKIVERSSHQEAKTGPRTDKKPIDQSRKRPADGRIRHSH
jgi:predicted nucleotidyltransferase